MAKSSEISFPFSGLNSRDEEISGDAYPYVLRNGAPFDMEHLEEVRAVLGAMKLDDRGIWDAALIDDPHEKETVGQILLDHELVGTEMTAIYDLGNRATAGLISTVNILH